MIMMIMILALCLCFFVNNFSQILVKEFLLEAASGFNSKYIQK